MTYSYSVMDGALFGEGKKMNAINNGSIRKRKGIKGVERGGWKARAHTFSGSINPEF